MAQLFLSVVQEYHLGGRAGVTLVQRDGHAPGIQVSVEVGRGHRVHVTHGGVVGRVAVGRGMGSRAVLGRWG